MSIILKYQKGISENYKDTEKNLWDEINKFGRFWLMEGYFPPEDRDKWIQAIESLSNINRLVQEDIRDMILTGNDEKYKNSNSKIENQTMSRNVYGVGDKNTSSNKVLNTENSISDQSLNFTSDRKVGKKEQNKLKKEVYQEKEQIYQNILLIEIKKKNHLEKKVWIQVIELLLHYL